MRNPNGSRYVGRINPHFGMDVSQIFSKEEEEAIYEKGIEQAFREEDFNLMLQLMAKGRKLFGWDEDGPLEPGVYPLTTELAIRLIEQEERDKAEQEKREKAEQEEREKTAEIHQL